MSLISKILLLISLAQIFHSGFSSYEFHQLKKQLAASSVADVSGIPLPNDIQLEVVIGLSLFMLSVFLSFDKLEYLPLKGGHTALTQGKYLQEIDMNKATTIDNLMGSDPYGYINYTPAFVDIHAKRQEVSEWLAKNGGKGEEVESKKNK